MSLCRVRGTENLLVALLSDHEPTVIPSFGAGTPLVNGFASLTEFVVHILERPLAYLLGPLTQFARIVAAFILQNDPPLKHAVSKVGQQPVPNPYPHVDSEERILPPKPQVVEVRVRVTHDEDLGRLDHQIEKDDVVRWRVLQLDRIRVVPACFPVPQ